MMTSRFGPVYVSIAGYMIAACACATLAAAGRVGPQTYHAGAGKLVPVDDCRTDPEFASFRNALLKAIAQRSVARLRALLGPMIQVDFEAPVTREVFLQDWEKGFPDAQAEFRRDVRDALELGVTKEGNGAYAPAIYLALGESDYDMVITGRSVKVYAEPSTTSHVIARWRLIWSTKAPMTISLGRTAASRLAGSSTTGDRSSRLLAKTRGYQQNMCVTAKTRDCILKKLTVAGSSPRSWQGTDRHRRRLTSCAQRSARGDVTLSLHPGRWGGF